VNVPNDPDEQRFFLAKTTHRIAPLILAFYNLRVYTDPYFHLVDLNAFVEQFTQIAPGSPYRVMNELRNQNQLGYIVVNRAQSFYMFTLPPLVSVTGVPIIVADDGSFALVDADELV
jgi:hypothetical protein